jgi:hypothetical protein
MSGAFTLTANLANVLQGYGAGPGDVRLDFRSMDGIAHAVHDVRTPITGLPLSLLELLVDRQSMRIAPFTVAGGRSLVTPMVFALWRPEVTRNDGRPSVAPEMLKPARVGLGKMPPPSVLVDGRHEVWAGWFLTSPLALADAAPVLATLAEHLGAVVLPASDLAACHLPLCGPVRNWSTVHIEHVELLEAHAQRRYELSQLLSAAKGK